MCNFADIEKAILALPIIYEAVLWMYELHLYIIISIVFETGGGMLYGVAVGFNPLLVFATTLTINIITVFAAIFLIDRLLSWKKG